MNDWPRLKELFAAVSEVPAAQRPAFLDAACKQDFTLRAEVEKLLESDRRTTLFLEKPPPVPVEPGQAQSRSPRGGTSSVNEKQIGPYKLLEKLGEGGMGVVYAADQQAPIRRRVALKLIKRGMDTDEVLRRFEAEKQALSLMDHPNIARVLDAGASADGRPYFVMEYVSGLPITRYCDEQRLGIEARLRLFIDCCQAIQHAHQKGIIHGDVKPSNALVMIHENRPAVKMIDFGVAKATDHRLNERTLYTEQGVLIGTPEYMSPEQAEMSALNVDTRTDVYSLGVLLYELLSGTLPFDPVSLRGSGIADIQRKIRELEPLMPSVRLSRLDSQPEIDPNGRPKALGKRPGDAVSLDEIAWRRRMGPEALRKALRGDLDWITMRAMEKDRTRRYSTAAEFALDIECYLRGEPVEAGPPSATYRLCKFVRRNRGLVGGVVVVAASLVAGIAGTTWGMLEARRNEKVAMDAALRADAAMTSEKEARQIAQSEAANARFVARTAAEQATYVNRHMAAMLPMLRRGFDLAVDLPDRLRAEYPAELMEDSGRWIENLLPEFFGAARDQPLYSAVSDTARCTVEREKFFTAAQWTQAHDARINTLIEQSRRFRFQSSPSFGEGSDQLWQALLPEHHRLNVVSNVLGAAAIGRHLHGDALGALECLKARRRVALAASYGGTLIAMLSEYAWRQSVYQHYRWMVADLAERGPIPEEFRQFLSDDRPVPSPELTVVFEGLALRQIASGLFTKTADDAPPRVDREALKRVFAQFDNSQATFDEFLNADHASTMAALDAYDKLSEALGQATSGPVDKAKIEPLYKTIAANPILRSWVGPLERSMRAYLRVLMERDASILVLKLSEFRAREGRWPTALSEFAAGGPPAPLHQQYLGAGFLYSVKDGRPLLYHPGFDGVDNHAEAPVKSLGDDAAGADVVFLGADEDLRPRREWLPR